MGRIKIARPKSLVGPQPPSVSQGTWQALFEAADDFVDLEPWNLMGDTETYGVYDEELGRTGWGIVLGQGGEIFGLAFYQELEGLSQLKQVLASKEQNPHRNFDFVASLNVINFNWVPGHELSNYDRKTLKSAGRPSSGKERYHQFQSLRPGFHPWPLDEQEALFMLKGLWAGISFHEGLVDGENPFETAAPGAIPMLKFRKNGKSEVLHVKPDPWQTPALVPAVLDDLSLARLRKDGINPKGVWQGGHFYLRNEVMDAARPYYPRAVALANKSTRHGYPLQLLGPGSNLAQAFLEAVLNAANKEGVLPAEIELSDIHLLKAVAGCMAQIGVSVSLQPSLPALDHLKQGMAEAFSGTH